LVGEGLEEEGLDSPMPLPGDLLEVPAAALLELEVPYVSLEAA
jgi:hypothetical protein